MIKANNLNLKELLEHIHLGTELWISDDMWTDKDNYDTSVFECVFDGFAETALKSLKLLNIEDRMVVAYGFDKSKLYIYVTDRDYTKFEFPLKVV